MKLKTLSIAMMSMAVPGLAAADELLTMQKKPKQLGNACGPLQRSTLF
jgi:hypothetical protein